MTKVISNLRKEHENFKKLLNLLDTQLYLLRKEEEPDYQLMTDILCYMTQYADLVHHTKEEAIFYHVAERKPNVAENVAYIVKQHRMIEKYGASFYEYLKDIIGGQRIMQLNNIEKAGRLYSTTLRSHLNQENRDLFGLAEQLLNENDWKKIEASTQSKSDPIFGDEPIKDRFHLLCDQLVQSDNASAASS